MLLTNSAGVNESARGPHIAAMRTDRSALVRVLEAHGVELIGNNCRCPFPANHAHGDRNPSAGIYQSRADGAWRFKCMVPTCEGNAGGDVFDLIAALGGQPLA